MRAGPQNFEVCINEINQDIKKQKQTSYSLSKSGSSPILDTVKQKSKQLKLNQQNLSSLGLQQQLIEIGDNDSEADELNHSNEGDESLADNDPQ